MIARVVLLFLFGTTISSGQLLSKLRSPPYEISVKASAQPSGCPTASELAPLICKLIQQNIDLYYKPKLIEPLTYVPPIVVEKCDTPELQMEIELPEPEIVKKPLVIPQPPELPPIVIPQFPVPVFIEEPPKAAEPCESSDIPELTAVNIPEAPASLPIEIPTSPQIVEQPESYYKPIEIPQPPELPPFSMPELPVIYEQEQPITATPCLDDKLTPELPAIIQPLVPVPAPELLASVPEFPIHFDIPSVPILPPPMNIPSPPMIIEQKEPCLNEVNPPEIDYNLIDYQPISIPQPPELPPFTMPELPVIYEQEQPITATPCLDDKLTPELPAIIQPLVPVPAPELLASVPEFPIHFDIPSVPILPPPMNIPSPPMIIEQKEPCLNEVNPPEIDYNLIEYQPISIPQPPELPAFVMPELPVISVEQEKPTIAEPCVEDQPAAIVPTPEYIEPVSIPQPPELPAFVMPELPVQVMEQEPTVVAAPCLEDESAHIPTIPALFQRLPSVPEAPELPPAKFPEFPVHFDMPIGPQIGVQLPVDISSPPIFFEEPKEPSFTEELATPKPEPVVIPEAPKLPELVMPYFPLKFTIDEPAIPQPTLNGEPCESSGKPLVQIATMNPYFERHFPTYVTINNEKIKESHKVLVPSKPIDPNFFPARCVYNLVMEHVIPNIASDRFRSLENIEVLPPPTLPCT